MDLVLVLEHGFHLGRGDARGCSHGGQKRNWCPKCSGDRGEGRRPEEGLIRRDFLAICANLWSTREGTELKIAAMYA